MRRVLWQRYRDLGLGEEDPQPRPVIGSLHVAGGFVIPALLGAEIRFAPDAAPQPLPRTVTAQEIDAFEKPDFRTSWPMRELLTQMDALEAEYGYVIGDLNTDGVLNAAYHFYGQDLFADFYLAPERVRRFLDIIGELIVDVALAVRERTGSCSISVNRMVEHVDRRMFYHANCSVQMISPASYRQLHLPVEQAMAQRIQPFGIHHCGANLHKVADGLRRTRSGHGGRGLGIGREGGGCCLAGDLSQPAAQPNAYAALHAAGDRRGHRDAAAGCRRAGTLRNLLHQHGLRHTRRQHLRDVRGGGTLPESRSVI